MRKKKRQPPQHPARYGTDPTAHRSFAQVREAEQAAFRARLSLPRSPKFRQWLLDAAIKISQLESDGAHANVDRR